MWCEINITESFSSKIAVQFWKDKFEIKACNIWKDSHKISFKKMLSLMLSPKYIPKFPSTLNEFAKLIPKIKIKFYKIFIRLGWI